MKYTPGIPGLLEALEFAGLLGFGVSWRVVVAQGWRSRAFSIASVRAWKGQPIMTGRHRN